jgi:hypothetical protein
MCNERQFGNPGKVFVWTSIGFRSGSAGLGSARQFASRMLMSGQKNVYHSEQVLTIEIVCVVW